MFHDRFGLSYFLLRTGAALVLGSHWAESGLDGSQLRLGGEIGEFVRIGLVIVQLLGAVGMADLTVALAAYGVVVAAPSGDGRAIPFRLRIL